MPRNFYKFLAEHFSLEELEDLAFNLGFPLEEIAGNTLTAKARGVQEYIRRRSRQDELLTAVAKVRPDLDLRPYGGPPPFADKQEVATADPGSTGSEPESEVNGRSELTRLRIDAALPEAVYLERTFDLAISIRHPSAPPLAEADLTRTESGEVQVLWPAGVQSVHLRLHVSAPECTIHGPDSHAFQLHPGQNSPIFYFSLTPRQPGNLTIVATVYQEDNWLGSTRVRTTAKPQAPAGEVRIGITSQVVESQAPPKPSHEQYANFDIRLGLPQNGQYPLTAESTYGETEQTTWQTLPLNDQAFQDQLAFLQDLVGSPEEAEQLGSTLRTFLFPTDIWNLYGRSLVQVQAQGQKGLRIRLRLGLETPELHTIPWEYVRDDRSFMALNVTSPIVRYLPVERPPQPITVPDTLKLLVVIASPTDQETLDAAAEEGWIRQALAANGRVQLQVLKNATPRTLRKAYRDFSPHILHFIGHGMLKENGEGALVLEDERQQSRLYDAEDMLVLLQNGATRLVVLSACKTAVPGGSQAIMGVAPRLVWAGVPAVIAMQFNVPDTTAVAFTRELYDAIASGKPLDAAVTEARIASYLDHEDKVYWAIPVLYLRAPDGVIWK